MRVIEANDAHKKVPGLLSYWNRLRSVLETSCALAGGGKLSRVDREVRCVVSVSNATSLHKTKGHYCSKRQRHFSDQTSRQHEASLHSEQVKGWFPASFIIINPFKASGNYM